MACSEGMFYGQSFPCVGNYLHEVTSLFSAHMWKDFYVYFASSVLSESKEQAFPIENQFSMTLCSCFGLLFFFSTCLVMYLFGSSLLLLSKHKGLWDENISKDFGLKISLILVSLMSTVFN